MTVDTRTGEITTLEDHEQVIARGLGTFVEVGRALAAIRDGRLYRESHETFESYCQDRWALARTRAYELISAAEITDRVSELSDTAPANEAQAKELRSLEPATAARVMREAHEATEGKPTAAVIRDIRERVAPPSSPGGSNPIADAKARVAAQPVILAGKAIERLRIARLTFEAAGDGASVVSDFANDPIGDADADLWLDELDATAAVIADLAGALRRRHIRSAR